MIPKFRWLRSTFYILPTIGIVSHVESFGISLLWLNFAIFIKISGEQKYGG